MNIDQIRDVVADCSMPEYKIEVAESIRGEMSLRAFYLEPDTTTGLVSIQYTRKWLLSPEMTKSEIVQTAFKCILTSMEHKTREWFKYREKAIFGPHFDVDRLHFICGRTDSFDGRKA